MLKDLKVIKVIQELKVLKVILAHKVLKDHKGTEAKLVLKVLKEI